MIVQPDYIGQLGILRCLFQQTYLLVDGGTAVVCVLAALADTGAYKISLK